jgi:cytochrome b involved in lipid metabolism
MENKEECPKTPVNSPSEQKFYRAISVEELSKHNEEKSIWIAVNGSVYDVTDFTTHPGTFDVFVKYAGKDVTNEFLTVHKHVDPLKIPSVVYKGPLGPAGFS